VPFSIFICIAGQMLPSVIIVDSIWYSDMPPRFVAWEQ
jgi:hypothetical protein